MRATHAAVAAVLASTFAAGPALAQIYRWVDEKGVTHYEEKAGAKGARPVDLADPTGGAKPAEKAPSTTRTYIRSDGSSVTVVEQRNETKLEQQEREFQQRHSQRRAEIDNDNRRRSSIAAAEQSRRRASCESAQRNLASTSLRSPQQRRYYQDIVSRNC
jgi:uncharacterized protein DUF4124